MNTILTKLIKNEVVNDSDVAMELRDLCEIERPDCTGCPVYKVQGSPTIWNSGECDVRDHGSAMLEFLRDKHNEGML